MTRAAGLPGDARERFPGLFASEAICARPECGKPFRKKAFTGRRFCDYACAEIAKKERARAWYLKNKAAKAAENEGS